MCVHEFVCARVHVKLCTHYHGTVILVPNCYVLSMEERHTTYLPSYNQENKILKYNSEVYDSVMFMA
jgi:hypothetical protein